MSKKMSKKMPQTVKKMQKINIKYLNDIAVFFYNYILYFFYGLKYKKSLPHRVKSFFIFYFFEKKCRN